MLLQIRHLTRGVLATVILGLVGIAMVAFLIPGGGMQFNFSRNLAEVGGRTVTPQELTRELDIELRNLRAQGANVSREDAINEGLHRQVLERMIARLAIDAYAERVGVSASDTMVAEVIRQMPPLRNPMTGAFDSTAYEAFLRQLGFSRPEFEEEIRDEIARRMLMEAMTAGARAPTSFGALWFIHNAETRIVSLAEAPASAAGQIAAPTEAQLQTFWEENQERLRVPEFRALTLVYANPQDFIARVNVSEDQLREEFEERRAVLTQPERRTYVRISAQTEQQANDAAARLARGQSPDAIAQAMGLQATRGENQARNEVPDAAVAAVVFSMQASAAPRVVRAQLAPWAVVRVESVSPATEPNLAALRGELRQVIAADEAADLLNAAIRQFEDARAAGASITDAARQSGLTVATIPAVEASGRAPNGAPVEALQGREDILETAFETPEGEATDFLPIGDADVLVGVDRIIPSTVRPLAEVRDQLTEAWIARERGRRLRELGEQVVAAVSGGQSFPAAARAHRFNVLSPTSQPLDRRAASQSLPPALANQIFAAAEGGVVSMIAPDGGAALVAHVERVNRPDPTEQPQAVEQARLDIQQTLAESFGDALQAEILDRMSPRRNQNLLDQLFRPSTTEDAQ